MALLASKIRNAGDWKTHEKASALWACLPVFRLLGFEGPCLVRTRTRFHAFLVLAWTNRPKAPPVPDTSSFDNNVSDYLPRYVVHTASKRNTANVIGPHFQRELRAVMFLCSRLPAHETSLFIPSCLGNGSTLRDPGGL